MSRSLIWLLLILALAECTGLNKYNSACYVFVWNAVVYCIPEDETKMQPETNRSLLPFNR